MDEETFLFLFTLSIFLNRGSSNMTRWCWWTGSLCLFLYSFRIPRTTLINNKRWSIKQSIEKKLGLNFPNDMIWTIKRNCLDFSGSSSITLLPMKSLFCSCLPKSLQLSKRNKIFFPDFITLRLCVAKIPQSRCQYVDDPSSWRTSWCGSLNSHNQLLSKVMGQLGYCFGVCNSRIPDCSQEKVSWFPPWLSLFFSCRESVRYVLPAVSVSTEASWADGENRREGRAVAPAAVQRKFEQQEDAWRGGFGK